MPIFRIPAYVDLRICTNAVYYGELKKLAEEGVLQGKHVAVFGMGDQVSDAWQMCRVYASFIITNK